MRRPFILVGIVGIVLLASFTATAGADRVPKPSSVSGVVTIDDATKKVWVGDAWLEVPMTGVNELVGQTIPAGKRLVIETISVAGNGSGPVTEDQGIERVEITAGMWMIAIPLDRYWWGSCPGFEPPENCSNYDRYWKYSGTEAVRAYVDAGEQISAFAEHPGEGVQQLKVVVLGYLVSLPG